MRPPLRLTSSDNPRLKAIPRLRKQRQRQKSRVFIAEGFREISRALQAGLHIHELYYSPELANADFQALCRIFPMLQNQSPSLFELSPPLFAKIAHNENPEGFLAVFDQPQRRLDDLPSASQSDLFLIAAQINKPGNLGAMARTASAANCTALLAADAVVDPFNPNAIRASTGAVFTLPIFTPTAAEAIDFLHCRSVRIIAATPETSISYSAIDLTGPLAWVIGAEDTGISAIWREAATALVSIPMNTAVVDSLNASNAAAILLFETMRQRRK